jgi:hypothetical protein
MRFLNKILGLAAIGLALVAPLFAQQYQSTLAPIFATNAKYVNGVAPGYAPTSGTALVLNLGPGTANCAGTIETYIGGTLSMSVSTVNYVYLNTAASCAPAVKNSAFTSTDIPIAIVTTNGVSILQTCNNNGTSSPAGSYPCIVDDRTMFSVPSSGGMIYPASGLAASTGTAWRTPNFSDVVALWACSGLLKSDGTCSAGGGGSNAQTMLLPNGTAGTTLGNMACWQNSGGYPSTAGIADCPATGSTTEGTDNPQGIVGVVIAGAGNTGVATVQFGGTVNWNCDTTVTTTASVWVSMSHTIPGQCNPYAGGYGASPTEATNVVTVLGRVLGGNTGAGTAASISLQTFPGYSAGSPNLVVTVGQGSPFLSQTPWNMHPSTDAMPYALQGNGVYISQSPINGTVQTRFGYSSTGASGGDLLLDTISQGYPTTGTPMFRINASTYWLPNVQSVSGTVNMGNSCCFFMNDSSGNFIFTLSGNSTPNTISGDNVGHISTWDIVQAASGGPYTWTWPANFVNAPVVTSTAGLSTVASFLYDGVNYQCVTGCNSSGGGSGLSGMTAGQVPIAASPTTVTSSKALAGSGAGIATGPTSTTSGDCVEFTGTAGQVADAGAPCGLGGSGVPNVNGITSAVTLIGDSSITVTPNSPSAGDVQLHATGGGGGGSSYPFTGFTAPSISGWTWMNQGSGTATVNGGVLTLAATGTGGDNIHYIYESLPSTPWTVIAAVIPGVGVTFPNGQSEWSQGISISDGTKLTSFNVGMGVGSNLQLNAASVTQYNSVTSYNTNSYTLSTTSFPLVVWLRIKDDGTTRTYSMSSDPTNFGWQQLYSEAHAGFLTPTTVGFSNDYYGTTNTFPGAPFVSFNVTTP